MKKIGIITIQDNYNLGNRLQNYAMQEIIKRNSFFVCSLKNTPRLNKKKSFFYEKVFVFLKFFKNKLKRKTLREKNFDDFNKLINFGELVTYRNARKIDKKYDFFIFGSDQIWNPYANPFGEYVVFGGFTSTNKKVAISPSIAIKEIDDSQLSLMKKYLNDFVYLSCRESDGSELIKELSNKNCMTLIDPTFALSKEDWINIERKPVSLKSSNYILVYFLGEITDTYETIISKFKNDMNCDVINIFDKNSIYYSCGPREFIYLIHHCSYILTDSFHGSVFSIIFRKQFRIFERKNTSKNMNSRLINLINVFNINENIIISSDSFNDFKINYNEDAIASEINKFNDFINKCLK